MLLTKHVAAEALGPGVLALLLHQKKFQCKTVHPDSQDVALLLECVPGIPSPKKPETTLDF